MHNIKELKIWNKAIELAVKIYEAAGEHFGLTSQTPRCAVSIPSNISEAAGRNTKGEFLQVLGIPNGSSYELEPQLILSEILDIKKI